MIGEHVRTVSAATFALAAAAIKMRWRRERAEDLRLLETLSPSDVSSWKGDYDTIDKLLLAMDVTAQHNDVARLDLASLVIVNCGSDHCYLPSMRERIGAAVKSGTAWVLSSDWALKYFIEPVVPGYVKQRGADSGVVAVEATTDSLWSDVTVPGSDPQWWLEGGSHLMEVLDEDHVKAEAVSHELLAKNATPVVAAQWQVGPKGGRVFHAVSHFYPKQTRLVTELHKKPAAQFLQDGLGLEKDEIAQLVKLSCYASDITFAELQTVVTAMELVSRWTVMAKRARLEKGL